MSADEPTEVVVEFSALLLDTLGFTPDEFVSIGHDADGDFVTAVRQSTQAATYVGTIPDRANVYFGVNPVPGQARDRAGRGKAGDVTRLAALWADHDVKPQPARASPWRMPSSTTCQRCWVPARRRSPTAAAGCTPTGRWPTG